MRWGEKCLLLPRYCSSTFAGVCPWRGASPWRPNTPFILLKLASSGSIKHCICHPGEGSKDHCLPPVPTRWYLQGRAQLTGVLERLQSAHPQWYRALSIYMGLYLNPLRPLCHLKVHTLTVFFLFSIIFYGEVLEAGLCTPRS